MKLDPRRIQSIADRLDEATYDGKYEFYQDGLSVWDLSDGSSGEVGTFLRPERADFCAHAPQDIRYLLALVEQLAVQRQPIGRKLRYELLRRAEFRCQACGASAQQDGARLEIDHIHPVSLGGTNDPRNLRVLCRECNGGKGAGPA